MLVRTTLILALSLAALEAQAGMAFFEANKKTFDKEDSRIPELMQVIEQNFKDFPSRPAKRALFGSIFDDWRPAGPTDSRGPCPMLNSLANHNILPRSGRDISLVKMLTACYDGAGFGPIAIGFAAIIAIVGTQPLGTLTIDLDKLSMHGVLETLSHLPTGSTHWDTKSIVAAHYQHLQQAKADDPAMVQMAIITQALGGYVLGNPRIDWVRIVFEEELEFPTILAYAAIAVAMSPDPLDEVVTFAVSTVISIFSLNIINPAISCALGLPGCDGSRSRMDIPGVDMNNIIGGLASAPGGLLKTGADVVTGVVGLAGAVVSGVGNFGQEVIGRAGQSAPWDGPNARIGSPILGGGGREGSHQSPLGFGFIAGPVQQGILGITGAVGGIPGKLIGGVIGAGTDIVGGILPGLVGPAPVRGGQQQQPVRGGQQQPVWGGQQQQAPPRAPTQGGASINVGTGSGATQGGASITVGTGSGGQQQQAPPRAPTQGGASINVGAGAGSTQGGASINFGGGSGGQQQQAPPKASSQGGASIAFGAGSQGGANISVGAGAN
ncbi:hypothetical protein RQP46_002464 [Phenoliferia psychrophenolica]